MLSYRYWLFWTVYLPQQPAKYLRRDLELVRLMFLYSAPVPLPTLSRSNNEQTGPPLYAPCDGNRFPVEPSTNLASIESAICYLLAESGYGAYLDAVGFCRQVLWVYSGLAGQDDSHIWNDALSEEFRCRDGDHPLAATSGQSSIAATTATVTVTFTGTFNTTVLTQTTRNPQSGA